MRIAMLHVDLPVESRGGVAFQVARLASELAGRGHAVTVFTLSRATGDEAYDVVQLRRWRRAARTRLGRLVILPIAFAARRYEGFDVVHAHGDSELLMARSPVIRTFYGSAVDEARTATSRRRRWSQRVHAIGEQIARRRASVTIGISEATRCTIGRLDHVVPCGVDLDVFAPGERADVPTVLFVGTLGGRKRGQMVVDAFIRVVRPSLPNARLWLVTDDPCDGPGIERFDRPCDRDLARMFAAAWVFTLPSAYEGFGVPYIEALASGTAVLATDNPGAREILGSGQGVVVGDDAYPAALLELLLAGERRRELAARGPGAAAAYGWAAVGSAYEDIYRDAIRKVAS
jgi:phosphatidylinositol alpha-mannosyltransferase